MDQEITEVRDQEIKGVSGGLSYHCLPKNSSKGEKINLIDDGYPATRSSVRHLINFSLP